MYYNAHSEEDFKNMRRAGKLAAMVLDYITSYVEPGVTTNYLNDLCHNFIIKHKAIPAPLNYKGFPKSICTSKNSVICHGIPNDIPLKNGDILNIDVTVILDGWHGDTSRMFYVGKPSVSGKRLCDATYECLMKGISVVKNGAKLKEIGDIISDYAESLGYSVVRDYSGHGIGKVFHCAPTVLHSRNNSDFILKSGMFLTIEPMINIGTYSTSLSKKDGWTVRTKDMSLSAQFEHSLGVTEDGCEIFTESPKSYNKPPY